MDELSEGKTGTDAMVFNITAMQVASAASAGISAVTTKGLTGEAFMKFGRDYTDKMDEFQGNMFAFGTKALGATSSGSADEAVGGSTFYGAAQRNSQLWGFTGLSGLAAQAEMIKEEGGDWRSAATSQIMPSNFFDAAARRASSLASYQAVRNTEAATYAAIKTVSSPTLESINPRMSQAIIEEYGQEKGGQIIGEINHWIKESHYPAYFSLADGGLRMPNWVIGGGGDKDRKLTLQNTRFHDKVIGQDAEQKDIKLNAEYPVSQQVLQKFSVDNPYNYVAPAAFK